VHSLYQKNAQRQSVQYGGRNTKTQMTVTRKTTYANDVESTLVSTKPQKKVLLQNGAQNPVLNESL